MEEYSNLIPFESVEKKLFDKKFFGFTAKRNGNRIEYTYISLGSYLVSFKVLVTKVNPNNIQSKKVVLGIKINDREIKGWKEFIKELENSYFFHKKLLKQKV